MRADSIDKSTAMPIVAPINVFTKKDITLAGGKGANLGELMNAGYVVPVGFIITTAAYAALFGEAGAGPQIASLIGKTRDTELALLAQVSQQIQAVIHEAPVPEDLRAAILEAYHRLGNGAVAVRSSATAEDLPEAAFAGQQETYLNIKGEAALLAAIQDCWASLWSERAISYRLRQGIDQASVKLAVVVQEMVPAEMAGVMFTADPISGDRGVLVIDANPGLGEAVVAGLATPDHFVVKKRGKRILEARTGRREVVFRARVEGGIEQIKNEEDPAPMPALPDQAVRRLAQLGEQIQKHFGAPQDIEWAWIKDAGKNGRFFILQARPMTALPLNEKINPAMRIVIPMLIEMWPERPFPLDVTTFTGGLERAIGSLLVELIGPGAPDPGAVLAEEDGVAVRFAPPTVHPFPGVLISPWLALWKTRHFDPVHWQEDPLLAELTAEANELNGRDLSHLSWHENLETLQTALALMRKAMGIRLRYLPKALLGLGGLWILLRLTGHGDQFGNLVSGVETKTTEINAQLEGMARGIQANEELRDLFRRLPADQLPLAIDQLPAGQTFRQRLDEFLDRYGHREIALTISQPAWKDRPSAVLAILKVLVSRAHAEPSNSQDWSEYQRNLLSTSVLGKWPFRRPFIRAVELSRTFFQIREDTHFYATLAQPPIRHVALELGRRLVEARALATQEDIFHLRLEELESLGNPWPPAPDVVNRLRSLVERRQAKRRALAGIPMFDPHWLTPARLADASEEVLLSGSAGSPGTASGPVRVICNAEEFQKLQAGDVLVAPVTNPAWTPLFQRAAAVVVDAGGPASHAAIVAREYRVPAVMGTINATSLLRDGQWIEVDGSRGLVLKAEAPNEDSIT